MSSVPGYSPNYNPINSQAYIAQENANRNALNSWHIRLEATARMSNRHHDRDMVRADREISLWFGENALRVLGVVASIAGFLIGIVGATCQNPGLAVGGFGASLVLAGLVIYCCYKAHTEAQSSYVRV